MTQTGVCITQRVYVVNRCTGASETLDCAKLIRSSRIDRMLARWVPDLRFNWELVSQITGPTPRSRYASGRRHRQVL